MPVALLFDLDGTLVRGGGAGARAMVQAAQQWARQQGLVAGRTILDTGPAAGSEGAGIAPMPEMAGRTDPDIFRELLAPMGIRIQEPPEDLIRLYVECLRREVRRTPGRLTPGVRELVEACAARSEYRLALATGNIEEGARLKLEPHGLNPFFPVGGYGSDGPDRKDLVARAWQRVKERVGRGDVAAVVIGDTPRDVAAAHANGVPCIAVATGPYDRDALLAAGADRVLPDLSRPEEFFAAVEACVRRAS